MADGSVKATPKTVDNAGNRDIVDSNMNETTNLLVRKLPADAYAILRHLAVDAGATYPDVLAAALRYIDAEPERRAAVLEGIGDGS